MSGSGNTNHILTLEILTNEFNLTKTAQVVVLATGVTSLYLLTEDEKGRRVSHVMATERTVDGGFMDEGGSSLRSQNPPLFFVKTHIWI